MLDSAQNKHRDNTWGEYICFHGHILHVWGSKQIECEQIKLGTETDKPGNSLVDKSE